MMKYLLLILFPISVLAQTVTTYDSRTNGQPIVSQYRAVDIADQNPKTNPDFEIWLRSFNAPSLIDRSVWIGISITNGITNAVAQLNTILSNEVPATVRERNTPTTKDERSNRAANLRASPGWAQGKEDLARLAEEIELLWEEIERLKTK